MGSKRRGCRRVQACLLGHGLVMSQTCLAQEAPYSGTLTHT